MAAATANAGIMIIIYSALDWFVMNYSGDVPLILSFGNPNMNHQQPGGRPARDHGVFNVANNQWAGPVDQPCRIHVLWSWPR
jgi:hypothetical protein